MFRKFSAFSFFAYVCLHLLAPAAFGQGLLVNVTPNESVRLPRPIIIVPPHPRPEPAPASYKIKELEVQARLVAQVATVQLSQTFVNTGSTQIEACFMFPLPYDGAIDQLTLLVDGKEFPGKLLGKDEARKIYEDTVRKNKDPALLEWMGSGMFKTSVFPIPAGAERKVSLRYTQLCRKEHGLTDFNFPLSTAKYTAAPIEKISINVAIEGEADIKNVYSPTYAMTIERTGRSATAKYEGKNEIPTSDFRLFYDIGAAPVAASVVSYRPKADEDGYFLLLATPGIPDTQETPAAKTVMFVVDRSGSMSGQKIEQAKNALKFVLNNLRAGDTFNIIAYESSVESFRPELQKFDDATRQAALAYVDSIYAGGGTNIDGALAAAFGQLKDSSRPTYLLFLTDGLPTAGETNEGKIAKNASAANQVRARMLAFGVGYDVNSRLLDRLAREHHGQSEYVRPNEDIEASVSRVFKRIQSPVMTDVAIQFALDDPSTQAVNRVYPKEMADLFAGQQLVAIGRYKKAGAAKVTVKGQLNGKEQTFDFPATLVEKSNDASQSFVERLWAVRRIGEIIDDLDLNGQNQELVTELVQLSTKHGVLTPYTSFLADENTKINDFASNSATAGVEVKKLDTVSGRSGVAQRAAKNAFRSAEQSSAPNMIGDFFGGFAESAASPAAVAVQNVRQVADKAFYFRNKEWVDSGVSDENAKKAIDVIAFSDDYFKLAAKHGQRLSQYLTFDEPMLLDFDGQAYRFVQTETK